MKSFNGTKCFYSDILFQCLQSKLNIVVHSVIFTFFSVNTVAKTNSFYSSAQTLALDCSGVILVSGSSAL